MHALVSYLADPEMLLGHLSACMRSATRMPLFELVSQVCQFRYSPRTFYDWFMIRVVLFVCPIKVYLAGLRNIALYSQRSPTRLGHPTLQSQT